MNIIDELFFSEERKKLDSELKEVIIDNTDSLSLRENILYHFGFENNSSPTLEHSKRLRAYLCLKFSEHLKIPFEKVLPLSVTIELFHNSTLIVDDIQDNDTMRCDKLALWKKTNISQAINAAFFLSNLSQAYFHLKRDELKYYNYSFNYSKLINKIFCGQQLDIDSSKNKRKSIKDYENMVVGKTGELISLSCKMGYMPFDFSEKYSKYIDDFARNFAILYQIKDDIEDINQFFNNTKSIDSSNIIYYLMKDSRDINSRKIQEELVPDLNIYIKNSEIELKNSIDRMFNNNMISSEFSTLLKTIASIDLTKIK